MTQTITALNLCVTEPPEIDNEIFGEAFKYNAAANQTKKAGMRTGEDEVLASSSTSSFDESDSRIEPVENSSIEEQLKAQLG